MKICNIKIISFCDLSPNTVRCRKLRLRRDTSFSNFDWCINHHNLAEIFCDALYPFDQLSSRVSINTPF